VSVLNLITANRDKFQDAKLGRGEDK